MSVLFLLAPGSVLADQVTLQPIKDNTLYEPITKDSLQDRSNGAGETMFTGKVKDALNASGQVAVRRAVIAFDIAGNIPAGSTINSVQLNLRCTKAKLNTGFGVGLHELLSDWGEGASNTGYSQQGRGEPAATGDATWRHTFFDTQFWSTPGGNYVMTASATTSVGGTGPYTWGSTSGMVADVQSWLDNPTQNFGWILIGDENNIESAKQFGTRENTRDGGINKPQLIVDYTPQQISGACCQGETCTIETPADCTALSGVYQGDGTSCSPNPCVEPFGACCAGDGTCAEDTQTNCEGGGGVFQGDGSTCATVDCPIELTPYVDALPVPGPATPISGQSGGTATYQITMKEFQQQLHSELSPTTVWGYDDGFAGPSTPGPLIEARTGLPVTVNWVNDIRELGTSALRTSHYLQQSANDLSCIHGALDEAKTVVHLHGGHVPAAVDGYPESTFLPGAPAEVYEYPNGQQAAPIWFHDHALGITRLNVYMGLAGLYLIRDDVEDAINLPASDYEIPLVFQDRKFNPDGSYFYPGTWQDMFFGDKIMVNGKVWPYLDVDQGKYRFRLLNGSGSRVYTLSLNPPSGTMTFTVIGNEGGLLEEPARGVSTLTIGPGERYDVVVDFEPYATNDEILLENSAPAPFPNGSVDVTQVMKFRVGALLGDTDPVPSTLRSIERLQEGNAVKTRDFELKKSGLDACGRSHWEIHGLHSDDITESPELGTTEIWRFINDSGVSHPMQMHLVFFQVLDRDGFTRDGSGNIVPDGNPQAPPLEESGWKDTAMVGPNEILRVIARFEDYKGLYAYHCHILEHEDHEMMRQFRTKLCGDNELDPTEECDDLNPGGLDGCGSCEIEEFVQLSGTAAGDGSVSVTIEGEVVTINPTAGQSAAEVAQDLAAAINANANLQALGVTATAEGDRVVTDGDITNVTITDTGLSELLELRVEHTRLWWGTVGGATGYDIVRGSLLDLQATAGDFSDPNTTETCLGNDQTATSLENPGDPAANEGYWFLVRESAGTYDSGSASQIGSRDSEIGASGNGCP
jgi:spore coat protein A